DPPPGAAHGAARERDHGADRRLDRTPARTRARLGRRTPTGALRSAVRRTVALAPRLRRGGSRRGALGRAAPGPAGLEATRAERPSVRVAQNRRRRSRRPRRNGWVGLCPAQPVTASLGRCAAGFTWSVPSWSWP